MQAYSRYSLAVLAPFGISGTVPGRHAVSPRRGRASTRPSPHARSLRAVTPLDEPPALGMAGSKPGDDEESAVGRAVLVPMRLVPPRAQQSFAAQAPWLRTA